MSDYCTLLELQKKSVGSWNIIHAVLTLTTVVWGVVWIIHIASVARHNKKLDAKIDTIMRRRAEAGRD